MGPQKSHAQKYIKQKLLWRQYIVHTKTFQTKYFIGPVHHTQKKTFPTKTFVKPMHHTHTKKKHI